MQTIQEAHNRQLEILKSAISEERREFARAQLVRARPHCHRPRHCSPSLTVSFT